ncbi:helix-turn-helix domain-containing protein [Cytophagaceae bacterium DM2B3-1]|uniref:Helix-turn-helix domain-containing protein n=1 Tax=Xanthocytophaga flava TaxID=3048013 RepID=A0ABT7CHG1_9BACT|nr:helix-turn-helix domain-containing protein [Xanthocytophaga flavus]MDJ1493183.1 helix-turn-helix domain-containing protein [Xanthocytophaga flavus]
MLESRSIDNDFLHQITAVVEENISNEQFGVTELAEAMNMSRSNLLRKVKKLTNLSVSQFISQVRLRRGMELLRSSSFNVSEISHQVGFNSTSYFIKCFREYYGYPPGEVGKREVGDMLADLAEEFQPVEQNSTSLSQSNWKRNAFILGGILLVIVVIIGVAKRYLGVFPRFSQLEKSIAVLPFKNDSNDSTNVYLINGLMESTLTNLQKIKELRVISRTSTEKYRNNTRSIPEMAKELNVSYFIEGSGQKIGDQIVLNIQLIEAGSDKHLWARQYKRETKDIFALQQEIAQNIAEEIEAIITPEEKKQIEKVPTEDLEAYDFYLKAKDMLSQGTRESLLKAIPSFNEAIRRDPKFALAYADAAMTYYYLDLYQTEKKYGAEMGSYADKAWLYDSKLAESLVAKALFYMHKGEYRQAVPYLEKALEYNPNSDLAIHFLSELYNNYIPDTNKYLEYALRGVRQNVPSQDSINTSYTYMHLSNAFLQAGFIDESLLYIRKSLDYYPKNPFANWIKIGAIFAKNKDIVQAKQLFKKEFARDTSRFYISQELGKVSFLMRDYKESYLYYQKFLATKDAQQLDIFKNESMRIGIVWGKMGKKKESEVFIKQFKEFVDGNESIYKNLNLVEYYAYQGNTTKAIEHLKLFSKEENFQYWVLLLPDNPEVDSIKKHPEFWNIMHEIENRFWNNHKKLKASLEEKDLL